MRSFPLKEHILAALGCCIYIAFSMKCPILYLFKLPCPACGVTRAIGALLRLDFDAYLKYNFMAVFLVSAVWLCLHRKLFKHRSLVMGYVYAVLAVNSVRYAVLLAESFVRQ